MRLMYQQLHQVLEAAFCHLADKSSVDKHCSKMSHSKITTALPSNFSVPFQALLHFGGKYFIQVNTNTTYTIIRGMRQTRTQEPKHFTCFVFFLVPEIGDKTGWKYMSITHNVAEDWVKLKTLPYWQRKGCMEVSNSTLKLLCLSVLISNLLKAPSSCAWGQYKETAIELK